jgi:hypothetical protein
VLVPTFSHFPSGFGVVCVRGIARVKRPELVASEEFRHIRRNSRQAGKSSDTRRGKNEA